MPETSKSCEKMRDFTKKYFHLKSSAVYNSSAKNYFSIVLMAVVNAGYRFIMVDVGNYGSNSDTGIWKNSVIGRRHINDDLGLPPRKLLPRYPKAGLIPHCFVGDMHLV